MYAYDEVMGVRMCVGEGVTPLHMESERDQETLKMELGDRAYQKLNWEGLFDMDHQISNWRTQENLAVLFWAKEHEPEKLAQAVGDVQHRHRVNAWVRSGGTF